MAKQCTSAIIDQTLHISSTHYAEPWEILLRSQCENSRNSPVICLASLTFIHNSHPITMPKCRTYQSVAMEQTKKSDTSKVQWRSSALLRVRGAHIRTISDNQSFVSCRSRVVWNRLVSGRGAGISRTSYKSGIQIAAFFGDRLTMCDSCMPTQGSGRRKHVELKMLKLHEWLKTGKLNIHLVSTHDNPANLITKATPKRN